MTDKTCTITSNQRLPLPTLLREAERRVNQHIWGDKRALVSIPAVPDRDVDILLLEAAEEIERLHAALGMDQPWPLPDVLAKLIEATEHLLKQHDCDAHGHEEYRAAADYGHALMLVLRAAPEPRDG